jgi:hypothetical protein
VGSKGSIEQLVAQPEITLSPVYVGEAKQQITYLKTPECLLAFRTQLRVSVHKPFSRSGGQLVGIGMPSEWEGAISDEVRNDEESRFLLVVAASLLRRRRRVKRDQMREVEIWGRLDGVNGWEKEVLERNQETPERAKQVIHRVEGRRGTNGEERHVEC